jgi:hypothetical protein
MGYMLYELTPDEARLIKTWAEHVVPFDASYGSISNAMEHPVSTMTLAEERERASRDGFSQGFGHFDF